ncbi:MAG: hypothetical protein CMJ78_06305 [Planctomycetaceae bacterium]|nr:hypothetical protein [Planctomycetaceae bacterium]
MRSSSYRSSRSDRVRRMMSIDAHETSHEDEVNTAIAEPAEEREVATPQPAKPATSKQANGHVLKSPVRKRVKKPIEHVDPTPAQRAALNHVNEMIQQTSPLTWVFTGERLVDNNHTALAHRTYSELISEHVRTGWRRLLDVVVDTSVVEGRVDNLLMSLDWRTLRLQPDIVSISVGLADSLQGERGQRRFRRRLEMVIESIQKAGAIALLNTPPPPAKQAKMYPDLPEYIEIIQSMAAEMGAPLIDHWTEWKFSILKAQKAKADSTEKRWTSPGVFPNANGHLQMALHLLGHFSESPNPSYLYANRAI